MSELLALRDINRTGSPEWLDQRTGKVYRDADGSGTPLRQMEPTEFLCGERGEALRDPESDKLIHVSDLAIAAARHYYEGVADQWGKPVEFSERDVSRGAQKFIAQPNQTRNATPLFDKEGRLVAMDLGIADVHQNATLPNYAAGYKLAEGVADYISPPILVPHASNFYATWNKEVDFQRKIPNISSPGGGFNLVNPSLAFSTYQTQTYTLAGLIPTEVQANADTPIKVFPKLMQMIVDGLKLEREIRVANQLEGTSIWGTNQVTTLATGSQWNGGASADVVLNLHTQIEQSFMPVTGIVMSELVWHDFVRTPSVQKFFSNRGGGNVGSAPIPTPEQVSADFQLPPIKVASMKYLTGGAITYVWGNHVVLIRQPSQAPPTSQQDIATAYTFRWIGGTAPDGQLTSGFLVRTFYDPKAGPRGSTVVVVVHNDSEQQTSGYVGGLILNAHR